MKKNDQQIQLDLVRVSIVHLESRISFLENILFKEIPYLYRQALLQELKETREELKSLKREKSINKEKKHGKK